MKSRKFSHDVLYVPTYLRVLSFKEKTLLASFVLVSSVVLGLTPIIYAATNTSESAPKPIYSSEAELWRTLGERD